MSEFVIGLTITVVSVAALLAGIVWMMFFRKGGPRIGTRKYQWKFFRREVFHTSYGDRVVEIYSDFDETINTTKDTRPHVTELTPLHVNRCIDSILRVAEIETPAHFRKLKDYFSNVAVGISAVESFGPRTGAISPLLTKAVFLEFKHTLLSRQIPFAVLNEDWLRKDYPHQTRTGQPLIHEFVHGLIKVITGDPNRAHDSALWSIDKSASKIYQEKVK